MLRLEEICHTLYISEAMNNSQPSVRILRLFAGSWCLIALVATFILFRQTFSPLVWGGATVIAIYFAIGFFVPRFARPAYAIIDRLLSPVGKLTSICILAFAYFTFFTLYALVLRRLGRDRLAIKWPSLMDTGWCSRGGTSQSKGYYWQY